MRLLAAVTFGLALASSAFAREPGFGDYRAMQESLRYLPPNIRSYYLEKAGFDMWPAAKPQSESLQLSLVGKWGGGPSVRVTGQDSILYLARGSEVAVVDFADTANLRVLSYIQAPGLVARAIPVGNRLYISSGYIETFDVSNPANPIKLGSVLARAPAIDIADTLVYTLYRDSFKVFSFADPANPRLLGACRDSGYDLSVCNGYAYVAHDYGLFMLDVRDPSNPHRIAALGFGALSVRARGNICCATVYNGQSSEVAFKILDVRNPASPVLLATIDSCGGYDIYLKDTLVFLSGYYVAGHGFRILDISDSIHPTTVGSCATADVGMGVWANPPRGLACVADDLGGLVTIDIANMHALFVRGATLKAGVTYDVAVQGQYAYVAQAGLGLKVLDVSDPTVPHEVGTVDSTRDVITLAAAVRDSFAFIGWAPGIHLRSVDVSDPTHPHIAGGCAVFNWPVALALRDSYLYVAEYYKFQVVNVARPRQPALIGSCDLQEDSYGGLLLVDTLAYVGTYPFSIISVSDPTNPVVVSTIPRAAYNGSVRDTLLFLSSGDVLVYSIADPTRPRVLDSVRVGSTAYWVEAGDSVLYTGNQDGVYAIDARNIHNMRMLAFGPTPNPADRLSCSPQYIYAACYEGGVSIFDTVATGISEGQPNSTRIGDVQLVSSPVRDRAIVRIRNITGQEVMCSAYTVAGTGVPVSVSVSDENGWTTLRIDLRSVASGVYLLRIRVGKTACSQRVVKL